MRVRSSPPPRGQHAGRPDVTRQEAHGSVSDAPDAARALDQASGAAVHRRREGERESEGLNKRHSEDARGQIQNVGGLPEQVGPEQAWPLVAFSSWRRGRGRPARSQRRAGVTHVWVPLHLD